MVIAHLSAQVTAYLEYHLKTPPRGVFHWPLGPFDTRRLLLDIFQDFPFQGSPSAPAFSILILPSTRRLPLSAPYTVRGSGNTHRPSKGPPYLVAVLELHGESARH